MPLESWQEASRDTQSDPEVFLIVEGQLRLSPVELPHSPHMMGVMHLLFCKYCAVGDGGVRMKKHSEKPFVEDPVRCNNQALVFKSASR